MSANALRPDDLLSLRFDFINLGFAPTDTSKTALVRQEANQAAYIVVRLAPQNIAEKAFFEKAEEEGFEKLISANKDEDKLDQPASDVLDDPPVACRLAGSSRLVFQVPKDAGPIPFTLEALLDRLRQFDLSVAPTALPPPLVRPAVIRKWLPPATKQTRVQQLMVEARRRSWEARSMSARNLPRADDSKLAEDISSQLTVPVAVAPRVQVPEAHETSIELPYRLIISPNRYAAWAHATSAFASPTTGRVELWHTRLATRRQGKVDEEDSSLRAVRAIWARDSVFNADDAYADIDHSNTPFRMSLDSFDRHNLVHLTSNFRVQEEGPTGQLRTYKPRPVPVEQLMLSTMGAWINAHGGWAPPKKGDTSLSVEEWRQRGTQGRDHFVRVVYKGFLVPFGHRASLIKITERKFHGNKPGNVAYLRQRMFIIVREPEKLYTATLKTPEGFAYERRMPLRRIRITTLVTPNLDPPEASDLQGRMQSLFWPQVDGKPFPFHLVAEDIEGQEAEFTAPLIFAEASVAYQEAPMEAAQAEYEAKTELSERPFEGQKVALADSDKPGDTAFDCHTITFTMEVPEEPKWKQLGVNQPRCYPAVRRAKVFIPAMRHLAGTNQATEIEYYPEYLKNGFETGNPAHLFAKLVGASEMNFNGQGDKAGGFVKPNLSITGLSRRMGPVGGNLNTLQGNQLKPDDFFSGLADAISPRIFGVIKLWDILEAVGLDATDLLPKFLTENLTAAEAFLEQLSKFQQSLNQLGGLGNDLENDITVITEDVGNLLGDPANLAPLQAHLTQFRTHIDALVPALASVADAAVRRELQKFCTDFARDLEQVQTFVERLATALQLPNELKVKFEWKPKIKSWPATDPIFQVNDTHALVIAVEMKAKSNFKTEPTVDVLCRLQNFALELINPASFIKIHFDKIEFFANSGKKADVNVEIKEIEFVGILSFVETLRSLIPLNLFSDPPSLEITEEGISAQASIALPSITCGVLNLSNMSLGAGFTVPFVGEPLSVRFSFCERHSPFMLTVWIFGGGGFFALTLDPGGVQVLEASFEFGAGASIDFGVASGSIHVMAGIYFKMVVDEASLTGYLRMGGEVDVLGIISVSIELYMELVYEFASGKCVGRATLTIEIEIVCFSQSVEISCERKFAGSSGDPTFEQIMAPEPAANYFPWREYCGAFAA